MPLKIFATLIYQANNILIMPSCHSTALTDFSNCPDNFSRELAHHSETNGIQHIGLYVQTLNPPCNSSLTCEFGE